MTRTQRGMASKRLLVGLLLIAVGGLFVYGPIPLPPSYHRFVDTRSWNGISNIADVLSNLGFLVAGLFGMMAAARQRNHMARGELLLWWYFFDMVALTAFSSGIYHLDPDNAGLVFDRLTIGLGAAALLGILVYERVDRDLGVKVAVAWSVFAALAVASWYYSETVEASDQRAYIIAQGYPLVALIVLMWQHPPRYTHGWHFVAALVFYALAKASEAFDADIYAATGQVISGHSLKHLLAAAGAGWLGWHLWVREPILGRIAVPREAVFARANGAQGLRQAEPVLSTVSEPGAPAAPASLSPMRAEPQLPPIVTLTPQQSTEQVPTMTTKPTAKPTATKAKPTAKPAAKTAAKPAAKKTTAKPAAKTASKTAVKKPAAKTAAKPAAKKTTTAKPAAKTAAKPAAKKPAAKPVAKKK